MKTFRARSWLKIQQKKQIKLSAKDVSRIGNFNTRKLMNLAKQTNKQVFIQTQYSMDFKNK